MISNSYSLHEKIQMYYLTLCTFSFEIKESRLSDTRCIVHILIQPLLFV
jgi:hypothetical protein